MKLLITVALFALLGCSGGKKENVSMAGTYKMLSQRMKSSSSDTTYRSLEQLKIFTEDGFVMYANITPPDTIGSFGFGTYATNLDTITETITFRSSDTVRTETPSTYKLGVEKTAKGYKQIIPEFISQGKKYNLTEEYESLEDTSKSPLDGAWKIIKAYLVKGKDTINEDLIQYKVYNQGYFIWGQSLSDVSGKTHTHMGFGKFKLNNNNLEELLMASTNTDIRGLDVPIDIEMKGSDGFKQTITSKDSSKSVEIYMRLKQ